MPFLESSSGGSASVSAAQEPRLRYFADAFPLNLENSVLRSSKTIGIVFEEFALDSGLTALQIGKAESEQAYSGIAVPCLLEKEQGILESLR